jgi:Holliday junction resolvase-like predicted endonuclease
VIVEVRWRGRRDFGLPEETVDGRKRAPPAPRRIRRFVRAASFRDGYLVATVPLRFDLIVVERGNRLRHHRHGACKARESAQAAHLIFVKRSTPAPFGVTAPRLVRICQHAHDGWRFWKRSAHGSAQRDEHLHGTARVARRQ